MLALGMSGAAVLAQSTTTAASGQTDAKKNEPLHPPTPSKPDEPPLVMTYLGAIVTVGLLAGAALIPSKRGHQD